MKTVVFNVAAESRGALVVLNDYYNSINNDVNNEYIFILSVAELNETANIKVKNYKWIKRSWIHRAFFDCIYAPILVHKYKPDSVVSLQNIMVPCKAKEKILFYQNILPLSEYRYKLMSNPKLWIYQNVLGKMMMHSIRKADKVIVQAEWIKKRCAEMNKVSPHKFIVYKNNCVKTSDVVYLPSKKTEFFYPANAMPYKNHSLVVQACEILKKQRITDFNVIFTLDGNENANAKEIKSAVIKQELPIIFVGQLTHNQVQEKYKHSVLIFPSLLETVGLPLLEAVACNTPIIASDCMYARETLSFYSNVRYFAPQSAQELAEIMLTYITH